MRSKFYLSSQGVWPRHTRRLLDNAAELSFLVASQTKDNQLFLKFFVSLMQTRC